MKRIDRNYPCKGFGLKALSVLLPFLAWGCGPKQAPKLSRPEQADPPVVEVEVESGYAAAVAGENAIENHHLSVVGSIAEPETDPFLGALYSSGEENGLDLGDDPQTLLEIALDSYQNSIDSWKAGELDVALKQLDLAYEALLSIQTEENHGILQEKEELRYLISKRIIEIYASQKNTAGDPNKSIQIVMNKHVEREIRSFQGREKKFFLQSYARSGRYREMILGELRKEGLPEQLSWLPLIESGFKTSALSRARALGMWQFISSTGYRYGLNRNRFVDERMDPEKATRAAIQYLLELHGLFGDWMTALAAYNCGETRVLRVIKSQKINYLDHFWDLYQRLPRETARYVPRFLATLAILEDPGKYGIELPEVEPSLDYETLEISKSVRLSDLEGLAGTGRRSFVELNPELRYKVTPETKYTLKVPLESAEKIAGGIASLAKWQLPVDSFSVHVVRPGETLSTIAARYRTSTARIVRANRLRNRNRIWPGQRLKIPGTGTVPVAIATRGRYVHRVSRGESLWKIAKRYGTTIKQIKAWNQLTSDRLQQGQLLKIRPAKAAGSGRVYYVKKGDTLAKIAKKHGVGLNSLLKVNQLSKRDRIYPDQPITLPD